jgi:hypothetical protein
MTQALACAVAAATTFAPEEQDILAAILLEQIQSAQGWSETFAKSERVLEALATDALAEFRAGHTVPLDNL